LPGTTDIDSDTVTITFSGPTFVTLSGSTFTFTPSTAFSGGYPVTAILNDGITA
jgi:hypothetical protein